MSVEPSTWAKYRSIFLGVKFAAGSEIFKTLRDRVHEDLDYGKLSPPIQILGRGAFGTVSLHEYEGECTVAVKELVEPTGNTNKETLDYNIESFQSELKLLKKLSHKNIVRTLGFTYNKEGKLLIVQEAMLGGTLKPIVTGRSRIYGAEEGISWGFQISRALSYLHESNPPVCHRDLKLDNVLVTYDLKTVKLCDFGLAKIFAKGDRSKNCEGEEEAKIIRMTSRTLKRQLTQNVGSGRYVAPENALSKNYDQRTDMFSFSILLWEILSHKAAYSQQFPYYSAHDILDLVYFHDVRPLIPVVWPEELRNILTRGWSKHPDQRPSGEEISDTLHKIRLNEAVLRKLQNGTRLGESCCTIM